MAGHRTGFNFRPTNRRFPTGFTLVELLVVVAIIAVFIAVLMPALQNAKAAARIIACQNNLRQLGVVMMTYADANQQNGPSQIEWSHGNMWMAAADQYAGVLFSRGLSSGSIVKTSLCPGTSPVWLNYSNVNYRAGAYTETPSGNTRIQSTYVLAFGTGSRSPPSSDVWFGYQGSKVAASTCAPLPSLRDFNSQPRCSTSTFTNWTRSSVTQPMIGDVASRYEDYVTPLGTNPGEIATPHRGDSNVVFMDTHTEFSVRLENVGSHTPDPHNDEVHFDAECSLIW